MSRGPWARGLVVQCCCCCFLSPCVHCPCRPCCSAGHCRVCRSPRLGNSEDPRTGSGMCQPDRRPGSESCDSCQWFTVFSSTRQVWGKLCRTRHPQRTGRTAGRCAPSVPILARPLAQPSLQVHGVSAALETTAGEAKDTTEQDTTSEPWRLIPETWNELRNIGQLLHQLGIIMPCIPCLTSSKKANKVVLVENQSTQLWQLTTNPVPR